MNTNLVNLDLTDCAIEDEGIIFLSSILPMTKITSLCIGGNCISRRGLDPLADAIMSTKQFRLLSLASTMRNKDLITLEDIKHFLMRIQFHPMLCEVYINANFEELKVFIKTLNVARSMRGLGGISLRIDDSQI